MKLNGTDFQIKVWRALKKIKKGKVKTYKEVAIAINRPKAARAVANACAKNPYAPEVPCHRVIRSDGTFTNTERRVQRVNKAAEPLPGTKPDGLIVTEMMQKLGYDQ